MTFSYDENFNIKHYLKNNKIGHFESIDCIASYCNNNVEDALESVNHPMCSYEINYPNSKKNGIEYPHCVQALGSLKHVLEYSHSLEQDTLESLKHQSFSYEFLDDSICVEQEALESLNDPICIHETNDCSLKDEFVEDLPRVPQHAQESLIHQICYSESNARDCSLKHEFVEDLPCVLQDGQESLIHQIYNGDSNARYKTNGCSLKHEFVEDLPCVPQDGQESLIHQICNGDSNARCETNDSLRHEFVEDLPCVPRDGQEILIHQICNGESNARYEFLDDPLCVPQDPIESLEFVNFWGLDSSISVDSLFSNDSEIDLERLENDNTKKRPLDEVSNVVNNNLERLENDNTKKRPLDEVSNVEINYPRKSRTKKGRDKICARIRSSNYKKNKDDLKNLVPNWSDFMKKERRCSHCDVKETPQWRAGPSGRNTLCNACGIRYKKTGKLLAEYRPAASPTFDVIKHSNIHKKILKFRAYRSI